MGGVDFTAEFGVIDKEIRESSHIQHIGCLKKQGKGKFKKRDFNKDKFRNIPMFYKTVGRQAGAVIFNTFIIIFKPYFQKKMNNIWIYLIEQFEALKTIVFHDDDDAFVEYTK